MKVWIAEHRKSLESSLLNGFKNGERPHWFSGWKRSFGIYSILGGGFNHFLCSPLKLGKMNPIWRAYFSDGLVQPPTSYSMHQKFSRGFDCASWRLQAVPLAKDCFNSISGALESIRRFGGSKPPGFKKAHLRDPKCMIQFGTKPTVIMG